MYSLQLIRLMLAHADAFDWSLQGFGMFRLYLRQDLRIHVWDSKFATSAVSTIHTHPWDFKSTVIQGIIRNVVYEEVKGPHTHNIQTIRCGCGGGLEGEPRTSRVQEDYSVTYSAGDSYREGASVLHESNPADGTITIVERQFLHDTEHALVAWPIGQNWVSAEPRPATKAEKLEMRDRALAL